MGAAGPGARVWDWGARGAAKPGGGRALGRAALGLVQQPRQRRREGRAVQLGVWHQQGGTGVHEVVGVGGLVVGRRVWVGHEDGRSGKGRYLRDGGGAGAGDHQVGGGKSLAHIGDVGHDLPAGGLLVGEGKRLAHEGLVVGARRVDDDEPGAGEKLVLEGADRLVEMVGPQGAAKDQQHRGALGHAEGSASGRAACLHDAAAHRVAGHHVGLRCALALEGGEGLRQGAADARGVCGAHLVGKARHGVLLVEQVGHAVLAAPLKERYLDVGAKAQADVRGALLGKGASEGPLGP